MNVKLITVTAALALLVACKDDPTPTPPPIDEGTPTATATEIQGGGELTPTVTPTAPDEPTPTPTATATATATAVPTPTAEIDPVVGLELYPKQANIEIDATLQMRWVGRTQSGLTRDVEVDTWASTEEGVATVDASGLLTGLSAGTTNITATGGGFSSNSASVTIVTPGNLRMKVLDAASGAAIVGAEVFNHSTLVGYTDDTGWIDVPLSESGSQTLTARAEGYYYASILDTQSREVQLPIRRVKNPSNFGGVANFEGMDRLRSSELRIGIITRSVQENPLALDFNTLIGPLREVDLCGVSTYLPKNFVGEAVACGIELYDYEVPGEPATYAAYGLAGDLVLSDMQALLNNPDFYTNLGAFMQDLGPALQDFAYSVVDDIELISGEDRSDIPMDFAGQISESVLLDVPDLPDGVTAEFAPMEFIAADMGDKGYLPIGLAGGTDLVQVYHPPLEGALAGKPIYGMAMAAQNGVGAEGPYTMTMAQKKSDDPLEILELEPFMPLLFTGTIDTGNRELEFFPIEGATMYKSLVTFTGENPRVEWDIFQLGTAPEAPPEPVATPTPGEEGTPTPGTPTSGTPVPGTPTATAAPPTPTAVPTPTQTPEPPSPYWVMRFPDIPDSPDIRAFHWDFQAYDTDRGTFEGFVVGQDGGGLHGSSEYLVRLSRNIQYNLAR